MKYKNYYNFELGNRDIYSKNDILGMTVSDLFKNELPLAYQYNTIGVPKDEELQASPNTHQYTDANGKLRWRSSSKTTEELLEEERRRHAEQQAKTASTQSQLSTMAGNLAPVNNTPAPQAIESPITDTEPLFDNASIQAMGGLINKAKEKLQNPQSADNRAIEGVKNVTPKRNNLSFKESVAKQSALSSFNPDYYMENLPVTNLDDDPMWNDLREYVRLEYMPELKQNRLESMTLPPEEEINELKNLEQEVYGLRNGTPLLKGHIEEAVNPYDLIQNDPSLSTEEKVAKIKELSDARLKEINEDHVKNMSKIIGGGILEIGSNFIPGTIGVKAVRGLTKVMAPITRKLASKLGKKVANDIVKNVAEGVVSAPVGAVGDMMVHGQDPDEIIQNVPDNMGQNSMNLLHTGRERIESGNKLKNIENFDDLPKRQKRRMQEKYFEYYDDYIAGTKKQKRPKSRPGFQLRDKEWLQWLKKARLLK